MPQSHSAARLLAALRFAADRHRHQRRKDHAASPYINHPIEVADVIARIGGVSDIDTLAAAVLHDTVEDTETSFEELEARFGRTVRLIVEEVTDDQSIPVTERRRRQVESAATASEAAKIVKMADKICNVSDIYRHPPRNWSEERKQGYVRWAAAVVSRCAGANSALEQHFRDLVRRHA